MIDAKLRSTGPPNVVDRLKDKKKHFESNAPTYRVAYLFCLVEWIAKNSVSKVKMYICRKATLVIGWFKFCLVLGRKHKICIFWAEFASKRSQVRDGFGDFCLFGDQCDQICAKFHCLGYLAVFKNLLVWPYAKELIYSWENLANGEGENLSGHTALRLDGYTKSRNNSEFGFDSRPYPYTSEELRCEPHLLQHMALPVVLAVRYFQKWPSLALADPKRHLWKPNLTLSYKSIPAKTL